MEYKNKRRLIIGVSLILLIVLYMFKNMSVLIRVTSVILGLGIFYFLDHAFKLKFKFRHYIYISLILFLGILFSPIYFISSSYDKVLHLLMPILGSIMIFFVVDKLKIKFKWKLLITFTSIFAILGLLEIGGYFLDLLWDFKLQGVYIRDISGLEKLNLVQDKIDDTMMDMLLGLAGSLVFTIGKTICYFYKKK